MYSTCRKSVTLLFIFLSFTSSFNHRGFHGGLRSTSRSGFSGIGPPTGNLPLYGSIDEPADNKSRPSPDDNIVSKQWKSLSKDSQDDLKTVSASFLFALIIRVLLVEPRFIPSLSMFPTFDIGDQLLVDKISHIRRPYKQRDVVVFNPSDSYIEMTSNTEGKGKFSRCFCYT
jgi:hypothetical protein